MTISKKIETRKLFTVSGKFLIPGTREVATISDVRVFAESRHQGSRDLKDYLQSEFGKKCPRGYAFSSDFALMNLQWEEQAPKAKIEPAVMAALIASNVIVNESVQTEVAV